VFHVENEQNYQQMGAKRPKSLVKLNNLFFQKDLNQVDFLVLDLNQVDFLVFFVLYPLMFVSYAKVKKQLKI